MNRCSPVRYPLSRPIKFGDTSHGIYSGGEITSPLGVKIPCPGTQPLGTDAFLLRVPGTPPLPPRSPEEVAADDLAGRTWLDYGIISGYLRRLYGTSLADPSTGSTAWIYADSAGRRWLVRAGFNMDKVLRLSFYPFGIIVHDAAPNPDPAQVVEMEVTFSRPFFPRFDFVVRNVGYDTRVVVEAIASHGQRVLLHLGLLNYTNYNSSVERTAPLSSVMPDFSAAIHELVITGTPPACSVELVTISPPPEDATRPTQFVLIDTYEHTLTPVEIPQGANIVASIHAAGGTLYGLPPGAWDRSIGFSTLAGYYYDHNDQLVPVMIDFSGQGTGNRDYAFQFSGANQSYSISCTGMLSFSTAPWLQIPVSQEDSAISGFSQWSAAIGSGLQAGSRDSPISWTSTPPWNEHTPNVRSLGEMHLTARDVFSCGGGLIRPLRFGSHCWGMMAEWTRLTISINWLAALGSHTQAKSVHRQGDINAFGWAGAHPLTGKIVDGLVSRCFL